MWNLYEELAKWTEKLTSAGLPLGTVRDIRYTPRLTSTWGQCKHIIITDKQEKICDIVISQRLADAPYDAFVDTLVHELLHTCKYAKHHDGTWKEYAEKANRLFGLNIKRTTSTEEKGIAPAPVTYRYELTCTKCGKAYRKKSVTNSVRHPDLYRCGECHGTLKLTKGTYHPAKTTKSKLRVFQCQECGTRIVRIRQSKFTKNYTKYRCNCGGQYKRVLPTANEIINA